jgi:hypothetical protein
MPQYSLFDKGYNSLAPINRFQVLSKTVKGGFSRDWVLQENLDTEEDTYSLQFYNEEDPRFFLCTPTYKEWINKQNQIPSTLLKSLSNKNELYLSHQDERAYTITTIT